ncbi:MAG: arylsulfatase [Candidatus Hinthialibacter antarcticus]|nr:arylsulfatase [Candidatus Hinthialibacter antarcticus]
MHNANLNRRTFIGAGAAALALPYQAVAANQERPNVILVMTDDQGYGDLGVHGNDKIRTPHLDAFAKQSVHIPHFYVCPVCAPTRACLMTGRYNYRTGVVDTYIGRAMMHSEETTLAEMLSGAGYKTGIFGKWHLGDNAPLRASEQGFQESLVHMGGGIGQPSDPPGNRYFDPKLSHNGETKTYNGYCTDIFADACIDFIQQNKEQPFFAYLATNAPHTPLQIHADYVKPYLDMGLDETTAKVYGMVENIDDNMGKLMSALERLDLVDNTIVIFMTDNGPQQKRYTANLRGRKGSVYEGGVRVPFYIRWPKRLQAGASVDRIAGHIDITPTILEACGVNKPQEIAFDGKNLMPLLEKKPTAWPDRNLYFQWHRGDVPQRFEACAVRGQRYKLVNGKELYDIENDPGETTNIASQHPNIVAKMRQEYLDWYRDVSGERGYSPPLIHIGSPDENPTILTPQDWRGPDAGWNKNSVGYWEVNVLEDKRYDVRLRFKRAPQKGVAYFKLRSVLLAQELKAGSDSLTFASVKLPKGPARLEAWIDFGDQAVGMQYVDVFQTD